MGGQFPRNLYCSQSFRSIRFVLGYHNQVTKLREFHISKFFEKIFTVLFSCFYFCVFVSEKRFFSSAKFGAKIVTSLAGERSQDLKSKNR